MKYIDKEKFDKTFATYIMRQDDDIFDRNVLRVIDLTKKAEKECTVDMPDADEKVKHGHWVDTKICLFNFGKNERHASFPGYKCSVCGEESMDHFKFCPECGAKMDEEMEE